MRPCVGICLSHINRSTQWLWFAEELRDRDIAHVFVLIDGERPLLAQDLTALGSPVYYLKHSGVRSHIVNLATTIGIFRRYGVTILHSSLPHGNLIGQVAATVLRIDRRVTTCENPTWAEDYGNKRQALIDRLTYSLATDVIACTDIARDYLMKNYGVPPRKLTVIAHSLKMDAFRQVSPERIQSLRERLGLRPTDFVIGMIARLERWKGHTYVIEALSEVVREHPHVKLLLFGSTGEAHDAVIEAIRKRGLQERVGYKGFISDTEALYRLFDIHVHVPTGPLVENFGITVIEGMASGCAQLLTRSGCAYYTARHMENAWVVGYQSSIEVRDGLLALIADPSLRHRLGQNALRDAERLFDYRVKVDQSLRVYGMVAAAS